MLPLIHYWSIIMHMVIKVSCIHSSLNSVDECMCMVFVVANALAGRIDVYKLELHILVPIN